jgi:hypothetical protein
LPSSLATLKQQRMIKPVSGSWMAMPSPDPYVPTHPSKVLPGMDGDGKG